MAARDRTILLTPGDPAGIGPEIARAALSEASLDPEFRYELVGGDCAAFTPGRPSPEGARFALQAMEEAAARCLDGRAAAVVTGPIHKARMYEIGFDFPGQTEFFADRAGVRDFAMLLTGGGLTVALVTVHVPLRRALQFLRTREIVRVGMLLAAHVRAGKPRGARVAVAGLNPHAGEDGKMGREEIELIGPAVETLRAAWSPRGVEISGPHAPDTVFWQARRGAYDAVLCMYHDQGLIPLKTVGFEEGVNVTLGLPFVRTSPDHGTAFELAGKGEASPASMVAAIREATRLVRLRERLAAEGTL
ncbi:MAG: 4-hydroxythreonine-4-phosphate dehydrogenase PdxA [Verrucomicrobia bacterium]|nr:4-hydroxythreonine-4-phosphate dehydrogenase PdxA [Verrucomicrobiota bacterium]